MAESLSDKASMGLFYSWLGVALFCIGKAKDCCAYILKALELGESAKCFATIGLAYSNLTWSCGELQLLDEGIKYGQEVLAKRDDLEPFAYYQSLRPGNELSLQGDSQNLEIGRIRGSCIHSDSHTVVGIFVELRPLRRRRFFQAVNAKPSSFPAIRYLGVAQVGPGQLLRPNRSFQEDEILQEIIPFCQELGMDYILTSDLALKGVVLIAAGQFSRGMKMIVKELRDSAPAADFTHTSWIGLARLLQIATRPAPRFGPPSRTWVLF
jgi:hypothetical protein